MGWSPSAAPKSLRSAAQCTTKSFTVYLFVVGPHVSYLISISTKAVKEKLVGHVFLIILTLSCRRKLGEKSQQTNLFWILIRLQLYLL